MERSFCSNFVLSPTRTIIETLIIPIVLLAYLPQYIAFRRRGTVGIAPGWLVAFFVFSTAQFACQLLNRNTLFAIHCIQGGRLQGLQAFSALLGYLQVGAQWVGAFALLVQFAKYRVEADEEETAPILTSQEPSTPQASPDAPSETHWTESIKMSNATSDRLVFIACANAVSILILSLVLFIVPEGHEDLASILFRAILEQGFLYISLGTTLASILFLYLLHAYDGAKEQRSGAPNWSTSFLLFQTITLLVLGLFQAFRPGFVDSDDGHWEWEWLYWYLNLGHVAVHYLILVIGIGFVLGMRLISWRRTAGEDSAGGI